MSTFAVIKTGGKQYKVAEGQQVKIEKLDAAEGSEVSFGDVLMVATGADVSVGTPTLEGAKVVGRVVKNGRARKVIVFKYRAKKRRKKKAGHRQHFTEVKIEKISA